MVLISPPIPSFSGIMNFFIKSQYEMMKLSIWCTRLQNSCCSPTGRGGENRCKSSGGAQAKGKTGWSSVYHQNCWKNLPGSQLFRFVKFSFPVTSLMPYYYAKTDHSLITPFIYTSNMIDSGVMWLGYYANKRIINATQVFVFG